MTRTDAITDKIAGFGELRKIAISWLLTEKATLQARLDRVDAELAATIAADTGTDKKEFRCGRSIH
jgi:hypothetical protein